MGMGGGKSQKGGAGSKASVAYGNKDVISAAKKTSDGFKFGGKVVGGIKAKKPMRKARGGGVGGSPFSSAHKSMKGDA